jgi:Spy/CpxP family protein refolding chaperone
MIESTQSNTRDIPVWLTALVVMLCIGGGGWMTIWYMRDRPRQVVEIPDDKVVAVTPNRGNMKNVAGAIRTRAAAPDVDGIQSWARNSFRAKSGGTILFVNYKGTTAFDLVPQYANTRTPEEADLAVMRMSVMNDATWRENLKVTDEQLEKLRKVPAPLAAKLDPADRATLTELWKAYHDGPADGKAAAEKNLLASLAAIGQKNLAAAREYEANRAKAIREALTPEQIALYRSGGASRAPNTTLKVRG